MVSEAQYLDAVGIELRRNRYYVKETFRNRKHPVELDDIEVKPSSMTGLDIQELSEDKRNRMVENKRRINKLSGDGIFKSWAIYHPELGNSIYVETVKKSRLSGKRLAEAAIDKNAQIALARAFPVIAMQYDCSDEDAKINIACYTGFPPFFTHHVADEILDGKSSYGQTEMEQLSNLDDDRLQSVGYQFLAFIFNCILRNGVRNVFRALENLPDSYELMRKPLEYMEIGIKNNLFS